MTNQLRLAYYGDDFTGSTDALEFLSRAGVKTALFIEPPTPRQLANYPDLEAIGVAGLTRSMPPDAMETTLRSAFEELRQLNTRHVHYKVCSTFDSSPTMGSIGRAIDVGKAIFANAFIPLLVAAPLLGRFCLFGNLFARMGIGSNGQIYRLDRHPSMSKHPVTPANESDLRLHLAKQTTQKVGLLDILQITRPQVEIQQTIAALVQDGAEVVLMDAVYADQLLALGEIMDHYAESGKPLFSVGSSGVEMALGHFWEQSGLERYFFQHFNADFACSDFAQGGDASLVFALDLGRMALVQHACAVSGGQHQLKAVGDLQQAVFYSNTGHGILRRTRG